jgi:hypothetical protein
LAVSILLFVLFRSWRPHAVRLRVARRSHDGDASARGVDGSGEAVGNVLK